MTIKRFEYDIRDNNIFNVISTVTHHVQSTNVIGDILLYLQAYVVYVLAFVTLNLYSHTFIVT
jgi:hypothetical protein